MQRVTGQREYDQERRQSHRREAGDLEASLRGQPLAPSGEQRHERCEDDQQDPHPAEQAPSGRQRRWGEQALPHVHMQQRPQGGDDEDSSDSRVPSPRARLLGLTLHANGNADWARDVAPGGGAQYLTPLRIAKPQRLPAKPLPKRYPTAKSATSPRTARVGPMRSDTPTSPPRRAGS